MLPQHIQSSTTDSPVQILHACKFVNQDSSAIVLVIRSSLENASFLDFIFVVLQFQQLAKYCLLGWMQVLLRTQAPLIP